MLSKITRNTFTFFVFFLLLSSSSVMGQYAKWKVGFGVQSEQIFAKNWNNTLYQFNTENAVNMPKLGWGWGFNFNSDYEVIEGLAVGLRYGMSTYDSKTDYLGEQVSLTTKFHDISVYGDFYILKFIPNSFLPHIKESFFVRVAPTYHTLNAETIFPDSLRVYQSENITIDSTSFVGVEGSSGFGLNLGVGYTQYVTDRISVTGMLNMDYSFGHKINGLSDTYLGTNYPSRESAFVTRLSAEVKVAYSIKQKLPLCPIKSCHIQQEHRHAVLGGATVRGNKYSLRQNQKYGDKHRGQVEPKKRKKTKTERQQKRIQNKEKRNRKRIRIFGAGH